MTEKTLKQLLSNGESESIEFKTTQKIGTREKILEILHTNPSMTREELADILGKSPNTIKEHIAKLKADRRPVCVRHAQAGWSESEAIGTGIGRRSMKKVIKYNYYQDYDKAISHYHTHIIILWRSQ